MYVQQLESLKVRQFVESSKSSKLLIRKNDNNAEQRISYSSLGPHHKLKLLRKLENFKLNFYFRFQLQWLSALVQAVLVWRFLQKKFKRFTKWSSQWQKRPPGVIPANSRESDTDVHPPRMPGNFHSLYREQGVLNDTL